MTEHERAKAAQYDDYGRLVYRVGFAGGTADPADDMIRRKPKNEAEAQCWEVLRDKGWMPTKRGWPDFFCVRGKEICAVEVKKRKELKLKDNQLAIMGLLAAKGIRCFLWSPDGGFEEVFGTVSGCAE